MHTYKHMHTLSDLDMCEGCGQHKNEKRQGEGSIHKNIRTYILTKEDRDNMRHSLAVNVSTIHLMCVRVCVRGRD